MRVIAGKARRLQLKTLNGIEVRPTTDRTKETLFNILGNRIAGCSFLDLFSGSGAIAIEALSRGADKAVLIEQNREAAECIRGNLKSTQLEAGARFLQQDVRTGLNLLNQEGRAFDLIFMDPPYDLGLEREVLLTLAEGCLICEDSLIVVEASLNTEFGYLEQTTLSVVREKKYKTNKHVFIACKDKEET